VEHDLAAVAGNLIPAQPVLQAVPGGQTGSGGSGGGGWRQRLLLCRLVSQACGCELQSVQFHLQLFILLPQALQLLLGSGLRKWCRHAAAMAPVAGGNAYLNSPRQCATPAPYSGGKLGPLAHETRRTCTVPQVGWKTETFRSSACVRRPRVCDGL
jgi:hypothetical protein